jgi:tellurite resistance protein
LEDGEKMLFELDNVTETCYYINIEEEDLNSDERTIPRCQQILRSNKSLSRETSYSIWKSSEESHLYAKHYTHFIQET